MTHKDTKNIWIDKCEAAFTRLKTALTGAHVLAYLHFGHEFTLETDASGLGLSVVLSQEREDGPVCPIAFASRTLQSHEKTYGISELEALVVGWAIRHFCHYSYGHSCTVYTYHQALKSLLNTPQPSGKLAHWAIKIQELDLDIQCRAEQSKPEQMLFLVTLFNGPWKTVRTQRHQHLLLKWKPHSKTQMTTWDKTIKKAMI